MSLQILRSWRWQMGTVEKWFSGRKIDLSDCRTEPLTRTDHNQIPPRFPSAQYIRESVRKSYRASDIRVRCAAAEILIDRAAMLTAFPRVPLTTKFIMLAIGQHPRNPFCGQIFVRHRDSAGRTMERRGNEKGTWRRYTSVPITYSTCTARAGIIYYTRCIRNEDFYEEGREIAFGERMRRRPVGKTQSSTRAHTRQCKQKKKK